MFYCDANKVGGVFCPEMDIFEGNRFTMASVPHKCDAPNGKHYEECDRAGCGSNIYDQDEKAMCPDSTCTIDTNNPYTHSAAFETSSSGQLSGIKNTFTQGDSSF